MHIYRRNKPLFFPALLISAVFFSLLVSGLEDSSLHADPAADELNLTFSYSSYREFRTIPLTMPLEAVIGSYYLGSNQYIISGRFSTEDSIAAVDNAGTDRNARMQSPWVGMAGRKTTAGIKEVRHSAVSITGAGSIVQFDFLKIHPDYQNEYRRGDRYLSNVMVGYGLNDVRSSGPVNVLMGISSFYNAPDYREGQKIYGSEYGTVFFIPGLQLSAKSVLFEAMLEVPVYSINHRRENPVQNDIRTNFGMKYILR